MTIKSNDQIALEFLQNPDQSYTTYFNGKLCGNFEAQRVLKEGKMFENGCVMDNGNVYWFSGSLDGESFVFSIIGEGVGGKLGRRSYEQFSKPASSAITNSSTLDPDDDPRSNGSCITHGDYNGRLLRCPSCPASSSTREEIVRQIMRDTGVFASDALFVAFDAGAKSKQEPG